MQHDVISVVRQTGLWGYSGIKRWNLTQWRHMEGSYFIKQGHMFVCKNLKHLLVCTLPFQWLLRWFKKAKLNDAIAL